MPEFGRWWTALGVVAACSVASPLPAAAARLLFVTNFADNTVSVVDGDLDREVQTIPVDAAPMGIALRRGRDPLLAVANSKARFATLIDPIRREALPQTAATGTGPEDVAFSADGHQLIATNYYDKTVTFTDLVSRALVGAPIAFTSVPQRLLVAADGGEFYVLLHDAESAVAVVDYVSRKVVKSIPVGPFASDFALTGDGSHLLVASFDASTVTLVDLGSRTVVETFRTETGAGIVAHPQRPVFYSLLNFDGQVLAFDYAARQALATIDVGGAPAHGVITPDGGFLYASNSDGNNVAKIDTATNSAVLRIAVGTDPQDLVLFETPDAHRWLWSAAGGALVLLAVGGMRYWRRH